MATLTFRGHTLWNDAGSNPQGGTCAGVPVAASREPVVEIAPVGVGAWTKPGPLVPEDLTLELTYIGTVAQVEALWAPRRAENHLRGALSVPDHPAYGSAMLVSARVVNKELRSRGSRVVVMEVVFRIF